MELPKIYRKLQMKRFFEWLKRDTPQQSIAGEADQGTVGAAARGPDNTLDLLRRTVTKPGIRGRDTESWEVEQCLAGEVERALHREGVGLCGNTEPAPDESKVRFPPIPGRRTAGERRAREEDGRNLRKN